MHIPENYLSPSTCAVMAAAMIPVWTVAVRKVGKEVPKEKMPLLGVGAAFSFLAMMFNVPVFGGSTGHAVGGTLIACLLGPWAACLSLSVALILQALLFGDGGVLAIGANCFNMAFILPFVGYGIFTAVKRLIRGRTGEAVGAGIGAYFGINAAALCTAMEFGIQPYLFTDAAGNALYCPYNLAVTVPAMMLEHLTVFGAVEVIFTVTVYLFIRAASPDLAEESIPRKKGLYAVFGLLLLLIAACPLGLLAQGTAFGEWDAESIRELVGYVPERMESGVLSGFSALFPDYTVGALPDWLGYILSAIIGAALVLIIFKLASAFGKEKIN